jgi:hypothetical protein
LTERYLDRRDIQIKRRIQAIVLANLSNWCREVVIFSDKYLISIFKSFYIRSIQGVIEMRDQILTTSYWLHVEQILKKFYVKKYNDIYFLSYNFFKLLLVFYVVPQPRRQNFGTFIKYTVYIIFYKIYL